MSDEIRMTLLHHSTNDLVEELLMWRGLAAEHLDRIAKLEYQLEDWTNNGWAEDYKARIAELEAENERLSQLLHDEMSQLEIATDLGNKRWIALNEIYEKSEKHSAWWCKRKAQEGLGIK